MKITIKKYLTLGVVAAVLSSCAGDFGDTNDNPNATTTPIPSALLTNAINSVDDIVNATQGQLYVQYLANSQYTDADNYATEQFSYAGWYDGALYDLQTIIALNTNEDTMEEAQQYGSNANQIAVAQILQSLFYMHVTDRWGDISYTEALKVDEGILQPVFDTQQSVYGSIIATLKSAQSSISDADPVQGDILFGGDMQRWKQLANTIRLTMALRMSEVDPAAGKSEFESAISDGIIPLDNASNIYYNHLANETYDSPWEDRFFTRKDYAVAVPLVERMQTTGNGGVLDVAMDPRLPVYADPTENGGEYVGMPYGLTEADAGSISNSDVSFLGIALREQTSPTYLFTAAQVAFSLAEAAVLGWTSDDASAMYYKGIELSLGQYGVGDGYAQYITNSWVAYDAGNAREQILTQKWIANYLNGYEAWSDWRRTGIPALTPAAAAQNPSGLIPVRQGYPVFERDLNSENYDAVVARQGEDGLDTPVWWDK